MDSHNRKVQREGRLQASLEIVAQVMFPETGDFSLCCISCVGVLPGLFLKCSWAGGRLAWWASVPPKPLG